jgi:hypothetical protein
MPMRPPISSSPPRRRWLGALAFLAAVAAPTGVQAQLRVIAHASYPSDDISLRDLGRLFRGEYGTLSSGQRAVLAEQGAARTRYVRTVTGMDDDQYRRHWIRIVFAGTPVQPPRGFPDVEAVCAFVARTPGAIAIVDGRCDGQARTLSVGGRSVGDPQYPLR